MRLKDLSRWYRFPVRDTTNIEALASHLRELPMVLKATPDYKASLDKAPRKSGPAPPRTEPDDPRFPGQWGYDDSDDNDVDAPEAWSLNTGRSDVTVAVVDDGLDVDHPDLDPGDRSRVIQGYDFGEDDSNPGDGGAHGTPVAGTIGASTDNNEGVAGLMWDLQIMPLKVATSSGDLPFSASAQAFDYARSNGADVINYSISSTSPSSDGVVAEAVYNAYASGMIFVGSSGNDSKNSINYPAALHTAVGVGATNRQDVRHGYSNYGTSLDLVAPSEFETTARYGSYLEFGGTSQSAPVVSGVAGLIFSESRDEGHNLSNNDVVHLLERTAKDLGPSGRDNEYGHGRVNAHEALRRLNDPYEVSHGAASFTKIYDDDNVSFPDGFTKENGISYGAGTYICDIYKLTASASFSYENTPWFWLPVTEKGFSAANPNDGSRYLSKSVSKSAAQATTYFYYVETNINGQEIGWVPFDPTVHKRNGNFEYTVIGKPEKPRTPKLYGTSYLQSTKAGSWTVNVTSGTPRENVQGESNYDWSASGAPHEIPDCPWKQCSFVFVNPYSEAITGTVRVDVSKDGETLTATKDVTVASGCSGSYCPSPPDRLKSAIPDTGSVNPVRFETPRLQVRGGEAGTELRWDALPWATIDRFVVQHRADSTSAWVEAGVVKAADSIRGDGPTYRFRPEGLAVGTHQFRLRFEPAGAGGPLTSRMVSAPVEMTEAYRLQAHPNPVWSQGTIELAVREKQDVTVAVYDVLGRRVTTLHDGAMSAQQTQRFSLSPGDVGLSSGTYFVRVQGESFAATRRLSVIR